MCQMCEYKRDMRTLQICIDLLGTVDFENFFVMNDLVLSMIYTMEINQDLDVDILNLLDVPEDADDTILVAMRAFHDVVKQLHDAKEAIEEAADHTIEELKAAIEGIGTAEEDDLDIPPSAFTTFFKGGEHNE